MLRNIMRILLTCFFGLLTLILHLLGRYAPEFVSLFCSAVSENMIRIVGGFFSLFPLAMWELLALVLFIWAIYTLIRAISDLKILRWITVFLLSVSIGLFAVTLLWGLHYYTPPIHEELELSGKAYSLSQLKEATIYYRDQANQAGNALMAKRGFDPEDEAFRALAREAADGYTLLSVEYDCFRGPKFEPKQMLLGKWIGLDGLYIPFTGESSVSGDTYAPCIPFVMCREMGHGMGFAAESESEFAAFLACTASDSSQLRYSGYFNAFSSCYAALYEQDPEAARDLWQGVSPQVQQDHANRLDIESGEWRQAVNDLLETLRDGYAEAFLSKEERANYDSVAELLTMWYFERIL